MGGKQGHVPAPEENSPSKHQKFCSLEVIATMTQHTTKWQGEQMSQMLLAGANLSQRRLIKLVKSGWGSENPPQPASILVTCRKCWGTEVFYSTLRAH